MVNKIREKNEFVYYLSIASICSIKIGSYHDNRKGIDTAIRAVVAINQKVINISLNILALGIERDRKNGMIMRQNTMSQVICFFLHHVIQLKKYWNG